MYWCLALIAFLPYNDATVHVDRIEINHYYREDDGEHVLSQAIFWDWSHYHGRMIIRDFYCLPKSGQGYEIHPNSSYHRMVINRYDGGVYTIESKEFMVTHTQYDIEVINRKDIPPGKRDRIFIRGNRE